MFLVDGDQPCETKMIDGAESRVVVDREEKVVTPAGTFEAVQMRNPSVIEKGANHKWYARNVGMVKDGKAVLARAANPRPAP